MRALLLALAIPDPGPLRASLSTTLGATSVDACHAVEAAVTWLENRPCDLIAVAGSGPAVAEAVTRVRRVSRTIPVLALVPDVATPEAGAAWLAGADDVVTPTGLSAAQVPEGLDEVRHPERHLLRRMQRLWYAGPADVLRQHLVTRVGSRFRDVGLTGEGLAGLTTQDVEEVHSAALVVNAVGSPAALVLGVRRVKRTYPGLAITVVADNAHHDAFRRAGADECVGAPVDVDHVLHAVARAQAHCRAALELDAVRARETRLRTLLEHLPEAVVLVSPEHAVLAVNLAALRLLGAHDARQVIGASLMPWLDADEAGSPDVAMLVDSLASGTSREIVTRTRHLAEPRRLQLRGVPFQRESGGPPASLIVMRDIPAVAVADTAGDTAGADARIEEERRAWDEERAALTSRIDALERRLESVPDIEAQLRAAQEAMAGAQGARAELQQLRQLATQLEALGVDVEAIPALLQASQRLAVLEQEELPALIARTRQAQQAQEDDLASLRAEVARLEAQGTSEDAVRALRQAAARLADLEAHELPALRAAAAERDALAQAAATAMDDARQRISELETALTEARMRPMDAASRAHAGDAATASANVPIAGEQQWLLQEIAGVGCVRTDAHGRIVEANDRAAYLCGHANAGDLVRAGALPTPLHAAAGDDSDEAIRFELCLQADDTAAPRWLAGVRLRAAGDGELTWWLAEHGGPRDLVIREGERQQTVSTVLEAATAECRTLVDTATRAPGPRAVDEAGRSEHGAAARALARAQAMLAQVSSLGRRRGSQAGARDLRAHLSTLEPLLQRLATEDVAWHLEVPDEAMHACVAAADLERCLTAMVATARDALPLGGRLTMSLEASEVTAAASGVRRPEVRVTVDAQGYGLAGIEVPGTLHDVAASIGGHVDVTSLDDLSTRLTLRLPRAFVVTQAA